MSYSPEVFELGSDLQEFTQETISLLSDKSCFGLRSSETHVICCALDPRYGFMYYLSNGCIGALFNNNKRLCLQGFELLENCLNCKKMRILKQFADLIANYELLDLYFFENDSLEGVCNGCVKMIFEDQSSLMCDLLFKFCVYKKPHTSMVKKKIDSNTRAWRKFKKLETFAKLNQSSIDAVSHYTFTRDCVVCLFSSGNCYGKVQGQVFFFNSAESTVTFNKKTYTKKTIPKNVRKLLKQYIGKLNLRLN